MNTERDELAERIAGRLLVDLGATTTDADAHDAAHNIAALLTEELGYRQPRQVSTVEELDAMPVGSVVRSDMGVIWEKDMYAEEPEFPWWHSPGDTHQYPARRVSLPATVLHVGGAE